MCTFLIKHTTVLYIPQRIKYMHNYRATYGEQSGKVECKVMELWHVDVYIK